MPAAPAAPAEPRQLADDLHKYIFAGKSRFTVVNPDGVRYTFKVNGKGLNADGDKEKCTRCAATPGQWVNPNCPTDIRQCIACKGTTEQQPVYFISLLTGPDNSNDYTYVGIAEPASTNRDKTVRLTAKSGYNHDTLPVKVARWLLWTAQQNTPTPDGYEFWHCGRCGRCGRPLTVPESVESGYGPVCILKM